MKVEVALKLMKGSGLPFNVYLVYNLFSIELIEMKLIILLLRKSFDRIQPALMAKIFSKTDKVKYNIFVV